jgi:hypothetical protein
LALQYANDMVRSTVLFTRKENVLLAAHRGLAGLLREYGNAQSAVSK